MSYKNENITASLIAASGNLRHSNDMEVGGSGNITYVKCKNIRFMHPVSGTIRVSFDMDFQGGSGTAYGKIYVNGTPVGTEKTTTTQYPAWTNLVEDITINLQTGGSIEIWTRSGSYVQYRNPGIKNMRLYYDIRPVAALAVIGVDTSNNNYTTCTGGCDYMIDGNLGVGTGTTAPSAKLHIGGTAGVDGIKFPDNTIQTTAGGAPLGLLSYMTNFVTANNRNITAVSGTGSATYDYTNHYVQLSVAAGTGYSIYRSNDTSIVPTNLPFTVGFVVNVTSLPTGGTRHLRVGVCADFTVSNATWAIGASFYCISGTWYMMVGDNNSPVYSSIVTVANNDYLSIVIKKSGTYFYVNGNLAGSTAYVPPASTLYTGMSIVSVSQVGIYTVRCSAFETYKSI